MSGPLRHMQIDNSKAFQGPSNILHPFKDGWMLCSICKTTMVPVPSFMKQLNMQGTGKVVIPCKKCSEKMEYEKAIKQKQG